MINYPVGEEVLPDLSLGDGWLDQVEITSSCPSSNSVISCIATSKGKPSKNENKTGKAKEPGKNTNCPAELSFSISAPCNSICGNNTYLRKNQFPLEIKLFYNHNH